MDKATLIRFKKNKQNLDYNLYKLNETKQTHSDKEAKQPANFG